MMRDFSLSALSAGLLAAFVGLASSFAVIIRGLTAAGASEAQAASGLMALSIAMGLCAILISLRLRQPVSVAWSTPGAALLAASGPLEGGFPAAVGAFLVAAQPGEPPGERHRQFAQPFLRMPWRAGHAVRERVDIGRPAIREDPFARRDMPKRVAIALREGGEQDIGESAGRDEFRDWRAGPAQARRLRRRDDG